MIVLAKSSFVCQNCGYRSIRWLGRCPSCGAWNTFVEELEVSRPAGRTSIRERARASEPVPIVEIESEAARRISTGIKVLDSVLGGGLVQGSVILLGGEPGIGKSTLSLELASELATQGKKVLYVSGEESLVQVKMRAERISALSENILLMAETDLNIISDWINKIDPYLVIVDSIQTVFLPDLQSSPGSVGQVRECAASLSFLAKDRGFSLLIIGHVTKEGSIGGPKTLEHLVDVVLYFEGQRYEDFRILRAVKNRFGPTNELAIFQMTSKGLIEVPNPSEFFLSQYRPDKPGVCIGAIIEGARPFLVEVQALVSPTSGFGAPLRRSQGIDPNRLSMLLAVLEKRLGYRLYEYDVFVNVMGGIRIKDPGLDLAVVLAIVSSLRSEPLPKGVVAIGEVGLVGDVRAVSMMEQRIKEAERTGYDRIIAPKKGSLDLSDVISKIW